MGTNTKILYGSIVAILFTLMLLFFSMSSNSQLKLDVEQSGELVQQKGQVLENLQQQLKVTDTEVKSIIIKNAVIPKLQATIDAEKKEKQSYVQLLDELQNELQIQKNTAKVHLAELTNLQVKFTETEKAKDSVSSQLAGMKGEYTSLQGVLVVKDAEIVQLAESIEQKEKDFALYKEQAGDIMAERSFMENAASNELLNLNLVLDELSLRNRVIDEFTDEINNTDEVLALVVPPSITNETVFVLDGETAVYAESLKASERDLLRVNLALEQINVTHQDNLFAVLAKNKALGSTNETLSIQNREQGSIIRKLQTQINKRETLNSTSRKEMEVLKASNNELEDQVSRSRLLESSRQNKLAVLKAELATKQAELNSANENPKLVMVPLLAAQKQVMELSKLNESFSGNIKNQVRIIQNLRAAIQKKDISISSGHAKIVTLQSSNQVLQDKLSGLHLVETKILEELTGLKGKFADKQDELDSANKQSEAFALPLLVAEEKVTALSELNETINSSIQTLHDTIEQKNALISSAQERNERLQGELNQLLTKLTDKQNELGSVKEQSSALVDPLKEKVVVLEKQLTESSSKSTQLEGELNIVKTSLDELTKSNETLSAEFESVQLALVQSEEKSEKLNVQYEELGTRLMVAESSLEKAANDNVQAKEETQQLGEKNESLGVTVAEKETVIQNLTTQLGERTSEISELKNGIEKANHLQVDELSKVGDQEKKIEELVAKIGNAETLSEQQVATIKATEEQLALLLKEKEEFSLRLQNAQQTNTDLKEQSGTATQKIVDLEKKVVASAALAGTISSLELELGEKKTTLAGSQDEITVLEATIASLEDERAKLLLYTVDTDNDGVSDALDKCADTEQEIPVNAKGCEEDTDNDGIANRFDLCSDTVSGVETDNTGCSAEQSVIVLSGVSFQFGTDTLTEEASSSLHTAAAILKKNPAIKMEVAGHTDSVGNSNTNQWLSTSRAKAVFNFLVAAGVAEDQLQVQGYGSDEPVADNNSAEGRAKNRRVELRRIQ